MRKARRANGSALVYVLVSLVAMTALVSLGVDVAHSRIVKTQLQCAADAAARAGARNLGSGMSAAQNAVVAAAQANIADGLSVVVDPNNDIDFGTWANGLFTPIGNGAFSGVNAVRVRCVHNAARGNAVPAFFGSLIGITSCDVAAQSTATGIPSTLAGFIGYAGVDAKNNTFFGGYSSSVTTSPSQASCDSNMRVGSNTYINAKNNDEISGDVVLGTGATVSGFTVLGSPVYYGSTIPAPYMPTWNPGTNPNSLSQNLTISTDTTLPGGTYWFTSLTINANVTFSGSAVVYVNGPITFGCTIAPSSGVPTDLTIYQYGNNTFGDPPSNGMNLTADVFAPNSDFATKNNLNYAGSGIFNTITTKNNANFYYDESQGPADGSYVVATVQ